MGIYNLNPRRVVWFSPNEPSNKYDIWLSRNAHLDENGEPTTDSNSQRDCDYIFKIYDCGKWNPIVGFNTTAANKIDTVTGADYTIDGVTHSGKEVYHPAIFTAESPNELYDAGTLGSLLSNPNFVSELEWYYLFNSTNYSWDNIFGDTNWFGDLIWETIQGGSSAYHLPFATTERCGGILSDTHTYNAASAFKPIEVKFYPTTNMYSQKLHRLCVSASDVIEQINSYYNDNPSGYSLNIPLANTLHIGGIKAAQDPNTADDCRNIPIVLAGPTVGSVWGLPFGSGTYPGDTDNETEYLYLPGWALLEWMKNPYFNQQEPQPFVSGWKGVDTQLRENSDLIWIGLSGVTPENTGKFCTIQLNNTDPSGATIDWVDLSLDMMSDINFSSLSNGDVLIYNNGQWTNGQSGGGGTVYSVFSQNHDGLVPGPTNASNKLYLNASGQWTTPPDTNTTYNVFTGATALADGTTGLVPQPLAGDEDKFLCADGTWGVPAGNGFNIVLNLSIQHDDNYTLDNLRLTTDSASDALNRTLDEWNYYNIDTDSKTTTFIFTNTHVSGNAIYIRVNTGVSAVTIISDAPIINSNDVFGATRNTLDSSSSFLFTIQFGIIKIEKLQDISTTPSAEEE